MSDKFFDFFIILAPFVIGIIFGFIICAFSDKRILSSFKYYGCCIEFKSNKLTGNKWRKYYNNKIYVDKDEANHAIGQIKNYHPNNYNCQFRVKELIISNKDEKY